MLDERSEKISSELKKLAKLRDAALKNCKTISGFIARQRKKPKAILQSAEATAQRIRETAEKNAVAAVKRREQQADAKIKGCRSKHGC